MPLEGAALKAQAVNNYERVRRSGADLVDAVEKVFV